MKGFVKVTTKQLSEAIDGFTLRHEQGQELCKIGIEKYYNKYYTEEGSWYTKWRFKSLTPKQFARKDIACWGTWSDILWKVMDKEDTAKISFWCHYHLSALDGPKAMVAESCDGYVLVDSEMAKAIQTYRGFLQ